MITQTRPITAEELLHLSSDGHRYELVEGELREMSPAGNEHGYLAMDFGTFLNVYVRANGLGKVYAAETGFKISTDPDTVRAPDVAFIHQERLDSVGPVEGYWPGAPDLVVEVVSPFDLYTEVSEKVATWLEAGSNMVVIDLRRESVLVYLSPTEVTVLGRANILEGGEVVPDWRLPIEELFSG